MAIKRVLIFNTAQSIDIIGGSQASIEDAIENFLILNYHITYVSFRFNKIQNQSSLNFNRYFITKFKTNPFYFIYDLLYVFNKIVLKKYFIIWSNSALPSFYFIPFVKSKFKLYTFHGPIKEEQLHSNTNNFKIYLTKYIYKLFLIFFNKLHFNTYYVKNSVNSEYSFTCNYQSIVLELLLNDKKYIENLFKINKITFKSSYIKVLIPRRLVKRTGVFNFIKTLNFIDIKIVKNFEFFITGDGEEKQDIVNYINDIDSSNLKIKYLGLINKNLLLSYLNSVDVICIPSIGAEGFCLPAKEALLSNKFVLHTGQGGLNETLFNYNKSIQYSIYDIKTLEYALNYIFNNRNSIFNNNFPQNYISNFNLIFNEK